MNNYKFLGCFFMLMVCSLYTFSQRDSVALKKCKRYLILGDSIYATKSSLKAFERSNLYYDSAYQVALQSKDTFLLFPVIFAKARIYDAWNKNPKKTVAYMEQSYHLFKRFSKSKYPNRTLYLRHLVAHAYEKAKDSVNCVKILLEIHQEICKLDQKRLNETFFVSELALIASDVKNYDLAERILKDFAGKCPIKNDTSTYDYKDHYYLTKARIAIYHHKEKNSLYLDSLVQVYERSKNLSDSIYYSEQLQMLYATLGNYEKAYYYKKAQFIASDKMNSKEGIESMQNQLLNSELHLEEREKELAKLKIKYQTQVLWGLAILLLIISGLSIRLFQKNKLAVEQSDSLQILNQELTFRNEQNELLTKELHHRTKNNLQMILGLLQMQERSSESENTQQSLQEARIRIESIANLHEQLFYSNNIIDFNTYIVRLVNVMMSGVFTSKQIITHLNIEQVYVPTENILPLALILNEWITNTVKYAKTQTPPLELYLKVYQIDNVLHIHYKDNGIALKTYKAGLGSQIVSLFCRQIKAKLNTNPDNVFDYHLQIEYGQ